MLTDEPAINLRALRESASLSQVELARQAGIAAVTIVRLEGGRHAPRRSTIRKLAAVLGVRSQELFVDIHSVR